MLLSDDARRVLELLHAVDGEPLSVVREHADAAAILEQRVHEIRDVEDASAGDGIQGGGLQGVDAGADRVGDVGRLAGPGGPRPGSGDLERAVACAPS